MNEKINDFLQKQTCCTICCMDDERNPYCFNCYFSFNAEEGLISFKSSPESYHAILLKKHLNVAGTVLPDKLHKLFTRGLQFQGVIVDAQDTLAKNASSNYHHRHPLALGFKGEVYTIRLSQIKMTDSSLGFGKKMVWERQVPSSI